MLVGLNDLGTFKPIERIHMCIHRKEDDGLVAKDHSIYMILYLCDVTDDKSMDWVSMLAKLTVFTRIGR